MQFVAPQVVDAEKSKKPAEEKPKENDKKPKVRHCSSSPHFRALVPMIDLESSRFKEL